MGQISKGNVWPSFIFPIVVFTGPVPQLTLSDHVPAFLVMAVVNFAKCIYTLSKR
jgi:hypothetical protein